MSRGIRYTSRIESVSFSLANSEDILKRSSAAIIVPDLFDGDEPRIDGPNTLRSGTTGYEYKCKTCRNSKEVCIGHSCHIKLNYPYIQPLILPELTKWLKVICFRCGNSIVSTSALKCPPKDKLNLAAKQATPTNNVSIKYKKCIVCNEDHPKISSDKSDKTMIFMEYMGQTQRLFPHMIKYVLSQVSNETVMALGKSIESHPRDYVSNILLVTPSAIRPDVRKMGGGRSTNDDLTTTFQHIIKENDKLPKTNVKITPELEKQINILHSYIYELIKGKSVGKRPSMSTSNKQFNSYSLRLRGKQGQIRKNMIGKRARKMTRNTITGDPTVKINQVIMPVHFAMDQEIPETVQEYNKKRLMIYVNNGPNKYPGCTKVWKKSTNTEYSIESLNENIEIETGDIIYRHVISGDSGLYNRQPSLKPSNIGRHEIIVTENPESKSFRMNVIACPWYDADFDGDQMNLIISSRPSAINEISSTSGVHNWVLSHSYSSPYVGQVDDSIIGMFELTRSYVKFDKYHAMLLFANCTYLPKFTKDEYTGRDIVSMCLEETPINFKKKTSFYKKSLSPYIDYDPSEITCVIENGKHISGVMDKSIIGKGATNGLYHMLCLEYGPHKTLDVMFNMQQVAIAYLYQFGYTIGARDLLVSRDALKQIHEIEAGIIQKSQTITDKLNRGEIIPPINKTTDEFYEEQQINNLRTMDDFIEPILHSINPDTNNLFKLIISGSKGKINHMFHISSAIGQILINGERIKEKFSLRRTLPYFQRFETSPGSRGYIKNSYISGMTVTEMIANAMNSRFDLISKALSTSVTGDQNRKSIKNLESITINNLRFSVKDENIVQFVYGEDAMDPRYLRKVTFPTVEMSDKQFATTYMKSSTTKSTKLTKEFVQLSDDRKTYRDIFIKFEMMNVKELMKASRHMPVDVQELVDFARVDHKESLSKKNGAALIKHKEMIYDTVSKFISEFDYLHFNPTYAKNKMPVPDYITASTYLMKMLIRSVLHTSQIADLSKQVLNVVLAKIATKYTSCLIEYGSGVGTIAAQSFSGPLTQYMLDAHHRSTTGGTTKSGMAKTKEVMGVKATDKMDSPSMTAELKPGRTSQEVAQAVANSIEMMSLKQFIVVYQIFFEKFGDIVHPQYKHEEKLIATFRKHNPLMKPPSNMVKWCIRMLLNKSTLILKNISLETIITAIHKQFPDLYVVHSSENAPEIILRIYMINSTANFSSKVDHKSVKAIADNLIKMVVRGTENVVVCEPIKLMRSEIAADGSIKRKKDYYGITTLGTNIYNAMCHKDIDPYTVQTESIQETYEMFGIEAARQRVISEIRNLMDNPLSHRHYTIYADEMTYPGFPTSIERGGLAHREPNNVLLRMGYSAPIQVLEKAIANNTGHKVHGLTGSLMVGNVPRQGTLYNSFQVNEEFVKQHMKSADDYLDML